MKINNIKLLLLAVCIFAGAPLSTEASTAIQLTDTTYLFTIDFSIDDPDFDYEIPIVAKSNVQYSDRVDHLGYRISADADTSPRIINSNALVLGTSPLKGVRYHVPKGSTAKFTLFMLATFDEKLGDANLRAEITKLPYFLNGKRTTVHQNQLDSLTSPVVESE